MTMNRREIILKEIENQPENPLNYYLLALEDRRESDWVACIASLQLLIQRFPEYHPSYYVLAEIHYQLDQIDEGTRIAKKGMEITKGLQLMKAYHELVQLVELND